MRSPALLVETSTTSPCAPIALIRGAGMVPPPATSTSTVVGSGSCTTSTSRGTSAVRRRPGVAHHDDAQVHQEGRGEAGVDDGADVELVRRRAADLLDDERVVTVADDARPAACATSWATSEGSSPRTR